MKSHPGGEEQTGRLLTLAEGFGLPKGARMLDMGAGAGDTVRLLRERGYDIEGIDLAPRSELVSEGDMHRTGFRNGSFDGVISQCAFFISGDPGAAAREACRILKPGGLLLLSDIFFAEPKLPGFRILHQEDTTPAWREYYIEAIWRGDVCECEIPRGKSSYLLLIARKETNDGSV